MQIYHNKSLEKRVQHMRLQLPPILHAKEGGRWLLWCLPLCLYSGASDWEIHCNLKNSTKWVCVFFLIIRCFKITLKLLHWQWSKKEIQLWYRGGFLWYFLLKCVESTEKFPAFSSTVILEISFIWVRNSEQGKRKRNKKRKQKPTVNKETFRSAQSIQGNF